MKTNPRALQVYKVLNGSNLVCYLSDYSLEEAENQVNTEVSEAFDLTPDSLTVEAVSPVSIIAGKPAYQHILDCCQLTPQRLLDMR